MFKLFSNEDVIRESIIYSAESGLQFQFREFSEDKYKYDIQWFVDNKGFTPKNAIDIINTIIDFQNKKITEPLNADIEKKHFDFPYLDLWVFTINDICKKTKLSTKVVESYLNSFSANEGNKNFNNISDFNEFNAYPIIKKDNETFIVLNHYSLQVSLYETPVFWMNSDKAYVSQASKNRGDFTEEFCLKHLTKVFGDKRVHKNLTFKKSKSETVSEADVLLTFANRAIVLQAKSKTLTIEARKGDPLKIKDDFKDAIQKSYEQGFLCAESLNDKSIKIFDSSGNELKLNRDLKEIYIICVVSDHYPTLSMQVREFLQYKTTDIIFTPYVIDVFFIDILCEFLRSPLYFFSYLNQRLRYYHQFYASHEYVIFAYHLKNNLYVEDDNTFIQLHDDIAADLDTAMVVRRELIHGVATPEGILTRLSGTPLIRIIHKLEQEEDPLVIELAFFILSLSEDTIIDINSAISNISFLCAQDSKRHDVTVLVGNSGLTIHCNTLDDQSAFNHLQLHCEAKKYQTKASKWFGLIVTPEPKPSLRFAIYADFPWKHNAELEEICNNHFRKKPIFSRNQPNQISLRKQFSKKTKIGRNEPCPCGSGKKYKQCHGK